MNEEVFKIRELDGISSDKTKNYTRIPDKTMLEYIEAMNVNMSYLYYYSYKNDGEYDINEFVDKIIANIYIILNIFNEMNVYPGYFFRKEKVKKMRIKIIGYVETINSLMKRVYQHG